jgi:hypothetical protein
MNIMKRSAGVLLMTGLLVSFYSTGFSQDYYGGDNSSWRKRPEEPQPKDKDNNNPDPSGYMSINFGFANPTGSFASPYGSGYSGYALPGSAFHFSMAFPVKQSNFGFALMFGTYNNTYDNTNYGNYLENSNNNPGILGYAPLDEGFNGAISNTYQESSIMGGAYATYPIGRLSIDVRLMIGVLLSSLPEQIYGKEDTAQNQTIYDIEPSNSVSLAFDAGIGVRCLIAKIGRRQLCALVNVDYLYSNVGYSVEQDVQYTPANPALSPIQSQNSFSGNMTISLVNITFGLGYQL